ncbi:unnamed protein product, partial [Ectocarpus fasciculatus]
GGGGGATGDAPESHRFSKTKVRGAVTLLKFAQAVRVGRGDTAGQHVLYVAYELPTFSDFMARHNSHLVDMARELGVDMTAMDWKSLLETEQSSGGGGRRPIPSPSPTDQSEHGCRSLSSSSSVQSSPQDNEQQFAPRASSEHALWHGGQLLQLQPTHPRPPQQQPHHHHQMGIQQYIQQLPSPQQQLSQPPPPPSSAAVGGVWGQQAAGPAGLPPRGLQGVGPPQAGLVSPAAPSPTAMTQGQEQALLSMPAMVSAQVGGVGGYGMVLPLHGSPLDGSPFPGGGGQGSCSPLGYGLGGNGGNLTPSPQQQQQQQQQQQLQLPVLGPHAATVAAVQPHQVYGVGHIQQGISAVGGGQVRHPGSHAGMRWTPGLVGQGPHGGGGSGGASRQMTMEEAAAGAEGVIDPPPPPPSSLGQHESREQFPAGTSSAARSLPGYANGPAGGVTGGGASFSGAPSVVGMMHAPVSGALEPRRQSSLPTPSGSSPQPAFTAAGARMANTPPAIASGRLGFPPSGGGKKGGDPRATSDTTGADAAAAAAAAAVAAGGGAAEAWERERSRFGVRGNRPSPAESRIAAVAIAAQNAAAAAAAAAAATEENKNDAAAAVGPGAVPRDDSSPPEPAVATKDSTAPAAAAAAAAAAPGFAESTAKGTADPAMHPYATDDGGDALDVGLGELSLEEMGGGGDTAALPGLNEIASNSRR